MVPFTIFQRLSSLGSGGGVMTGTFPPWPVQLEAASYAERRLARSA
jgi:hypothetical protein